MKNLSNSIDNITIVTGIWDLNREKTKPGWSRSFDHYLNNFKKLLIQLDHCNLAVCCEKNLEDFVWKYRKQHNTVIYNYPKEKFDSSFFPFFKDIQQIRQNPEWYNQSGWLKDSTQGSMELYNPMVMSKMFMLHNTKIWNPFDSKYYYWIDGGITNTVSLDYFKNEHVIDNIKYLSSKFLFIAFPYEANKEIHGFNIKGMQEFSKTDKVDRVCRGGFFGGHVNYISEANALYYDLLNQTLNKGYMGTEESIFTIMSYLKPEIYRTEMIGSDGLLFKFFENVRKNKYTKKKNTDVDLYLITYNSPNQLSSVLTSFEINDKDFLKSNLILINNSTNTNLQTEYDKICKQYNIKQFNFNNIGICGGRQFAAEHFDESNAQYMMFFEDDMTIDFDGNCKFGFNKRVNNLYENCINIMELEELDFLKLSFSEFYGDNSEQWSWHNVPEHIKKTYLNSKQRPKTIFKKISSYKSIPYASGEVYYSNWPHIISKEGNKKCFIDTKFKTPFEQTWMSHIFQLTRQGKVNPGILLASPITHCRFEHYDRKERKEN